MKILNIDGENLQIFWTTWGILMNFSGKMTYDNIKNHKKKQGFTLSLEDTGLYPLSQIDPQAI